jgi:carbon-monoxide dehydrogenase iron sulfur subunit
MKRIYANEEVCIGCKLCEIWCTVEHSRSKDIIKAFKHELQKSGPRVIVEISKPISFALQCRHCKEPDCVYACISGAMYIDENGTVQHDKEKCVGCFSCIMVCPYGAIARDEYDNRIVSKCDLCPDIDIPACVAHCPNEALVYIEEIIE